MDALGLPAARRRARGSPGPCPEIVALIEQLVARGFAYAPGNGDVYYAVRKFPEYGRLSRRNLDDLLAGARVEPGEAKRDPLDFALWKGAKPGEPSWDSPVGEGAAGLAHRVLGHDARSTWAPPSTSTAGARTSSSRTTPTRSPSRSAASATGSTPRASPATGCTTASSRSTARRCPSRSGNFFTMPRRARSATTPRRCACFLLGTHYRNPINFSDGLLGEAERRLGYLYETLEKADRLAAGATPGPATPTAWARRRGPRSTTTSTPPRCWASWPRPSPPPTRVADRKGKKTPAERAALAALRPRRPVGGGELGILQRPPAQALLGAARPGRRRGAASTRRSVEARIAERAEARRAKDFARSDAIRDELLPLGVAISGRAGRDDLEGGVARPAARARFDLG